MIIREIIIDIDSYYQFSSGRHYPIVIYEYFGNGKVEKLYEGYIDSSVEYLSKTYDLGIIWIDYNEMVANQLQKYLHEKGIGVSRNSSAYNYVKESKFRKRFISYWIEIKPDKYVRW